MNLRLWKGVNYMNSRKALLILLSFLLCFCGMISCSKGDETTDSQTEDTTSGTIKVTDVSIMPQTFEKLCQQNVTDVVCAEYLDAEKTYSGDSQYRFRLKTWYRGGTSEEIICVRYTEANFYLEDEKGGSYSTYHSPFQKGESYLLLLMESATPFLKTNIWSIGGSSIVIPMNDIKQASVYGRPLGESMTAFEMTEETTTTELIEYVLELTKDNPDVKGQDFILSEDPSVVISESEYVLMIRVDEVGIVPTSNDRKACRCTVLEVLKGDTDITEQVHYLLPVDRAQVGNEWIVALTKRGGSFTISSRNSVYNVSEREQIMEYLN